MHDRRMDQGRGWPWALGCVQTAAVIEQPDRLTRLERARTFIHDHYADALDLDVVARAAHYSRFHFAREFRRAFDVTPHQYVMRRRIDMARELLSTTELSVTEICLAVGYESLGSFSAAFQRAVGHSPSRYRRRFVPGATLLRPRIPSCFLAKFSNFREASHGAGGINLTP